jgi:hypothetical protein
MPDINLGVLVHVLMVIIKIRQSQRNYPAWLCTNGERGMHYSVFERSGAGSRQESASKQRLDISSDSIGTDI